VGKSIRLSKKFGLNPTIPLCFVCQKPKNEIALLGAAYKEQAPMHMVLDVQPCDECREKYLKTGVMLVEARQEFTPRGKTKTIPTGTFVVMTEEAFKRIFFNENLRAIPPGRILFVEVGLLAKIGALENVK